MAFDYIFFDLDGTITDSKPGILRCIRLALDEQGIKYDEATINKMVGPPFWLSMKMFFGFEGEVVDTFTKIYRDEYEIRGWKECNIYPGVIEMFETLKKAGKHLVVATSKPIKFTNLMLNGLDIAKYFDFISGSISDNSGETKKDVINIALNSLKIADKSRVLMIGDRLYDINGAHEAGIKAAGILWGYGDRNEFEEAKADYILNNTTEVIDFILNQK